MNKKGFMLVTLLALGGCAQIKVDKLPLYDSANPPVATGIVYALPLTVVRVNFKVDKTKYTLGKYRDYREIFAPDSKPLCKATCEPFGLQETVTITTIGRPDKDNVYSVRFLDGGLTDQTMALSWAENGLITGAAATVTNRSIDVAVAGVKLAAGIGDKVFAAGAVVDSNAVKPPPIPKQCPPTTDPKAYRPTSTSRKGIRSNDELFIEAFYRPSVARERDDLVKRYCALGTERREQFDVSLINDATDYYGDKVLRLAVTRAGIFDSIASIYDLAATLARLDTEIDKNLTIAFVGTKKVEKTWDAVAELVPRFEKLDQPYDLVAIDGLEGVCAQPAYVPSPTSTKPSGDFAAKNNQCAARSTMLKVTFSLSPGREEQLFARVSDDANNGDRSFRYRIPAQVVARVADNKDDQYAASEFFVAQLGTVVSLPAKRSAKALTYDLAFIEATGALKSFKLVTSGASEAASSIDSIAGAAGGIVDARAAREKARSETSQLEARYKELKLRDDICTLETKLGQQCTTLPE